jgi:hypothetical protein
MVDILPWVGLGILLFLALPIPAVQKLLLEISSWGLRLGVIALLAGGVYLWFRPGELPAGVSTALADFPGLLALLPERGTPAFGLCLACWAVTLLLPLLAALDAGRRVVRVRRTAAAAGPTPEVLPTAEPVEEMGVPILRPVERRTAAAALASAGSRTTR